MSDQLSLDVGAEDVERSAVISDCGKYRYELTRQWADGQLLEWVMLNPSTADAAVDDPTIRRCIGFARDWGFAGIRVTNLFAYRATHPNDLSNPYVEPIGPDNHRYLSTERGPITVCAWGAHKIVAERGSFHNGIAARSALTCLGYNKDGSPKHPLYVPRNAGLRPWPSHEGHDA